LLFEERISGCFKINFLSLVLRNYTTLHLHLAQTYLPSLSLPSNSLNDPTPCDPNLKIRHFVDLLRTSFLPQSISQRLPKRNHE